MIETFRGLIMGTPYQTCLVVDKVDQLIHRDCNHLQNPKHFLAVLKNRERQVPHPVFSKHLLECINEHVISTHCLSLFHLKLRLISEKQLWVSEKFRTGFHSRTYYYERIAMKILKFLVWNGCGDKNQVGTQSSIMPRLLHLQTKMAATNVRIAKYANTEFVLPVWHSVDE